MKKKSIEERINAMNENIRDLENLKSVLDYAERQLQWYKPIVEDGNGNRETDETGDYKRRVPTEDDYEYANYQSWLRIIGEIENLI